MMLAFFKKIFTRSDGRQDRDGEESGEDSYAHREHELRQRLAKFSKLAADDIMIPKVDVIGFDVSAKLDTIIAIIKKDPHSRYLVYRGTQDYVLGSVHVSDILKFTTNGANKEEFDLRKILRKVLVTVENRSASHLLIEMQLLKRRMAVVVDEYGGLEGAITINDIVGEIVDSMTGEDSGDDYDLQNKLAEKGQLETSARIPIEDCEELLGRALNAQRINQDDPPDTLGGLINGLIQRVPPRGEMIEDKAVDLEYEILEADPRRIHRVNIIVHNYTPQKKHRNGSR